MDQLPRPVQLSLLVAASLLAMIGLVFGIDRLSNAGEVLGDVEAAGVDIGGLDETGATVRLGELEAALMADPVPFEVDGQMFHLDPAAIDFDLDESAMVDAAMENGRSGNVLSQFGWWLGRIGGDAADLELAFTYDEEALADIIRTWELEGLADPAYEGEVWIENGAVATAYPAEGTGIDAAGAIPLIEAALADPARVPVTLPTRFLQPRMTAAQVDDAAATAADVVSSGVILENEELGTRLAIPARILADALEVTIDDSGAEPEFVLSFDDEPLLLFLAPFSRSLETPGIDAEILIDVETDEVTLVPSVPATEPDPDALSDAAWQAAASPERTGMLPYREGRRAAFSTADAEALGIRELIGEFTTFHPCCQARVINIQQIADYVDGVMIMPGEVFDLNAIVGKRTTARGFVCAGALVGGELVEEGEVCIGGGTSQFTTTMYNAAFFAGLEDVEHTPHSVWFSRYPEGREATLGWPAPNLVFRNNTENAIVVRTTHTGTSITAKIYGDNGGIEVTAGLSNRYGYTSIRGPVVRRNPEFNAPGPKKGCRANRAVEIQAGSPGWTVDIYRYTTYPDGTETTETWTWHYTGLYNILEFNPDDPDCEI